MLKKVTDLSSSDFSKGLNTNTNILSLEKNETPNCMDVVINHDLSIEKRLGTSTQNALVIAMSGAAGFSPDSSNSLVSNLKAYWKLDELSGSRSDSISSHTLTDVNGVTKAGGIKDGAANFVAANSTYLFINNTATLATGDVDFSISTWIYLNTSGVQQAIIGKRDDAPFTDAEYYLLITPSNVVRWAVTSNGTTIADVVDANSFGALNTGTWYNVVAWHDTGDFIGVSVNLSVNSASYSGGLRAGTAPFVIGAVGDANFTDFFTGRIDETGVWKKVLSPTDRINLYNSGTGNTYARAFDQQTWASFDFGASNLRWLTVAAGTGIYASSNLGVTWVNIATDRTATYQYLDRSKNALIATSDNYDTVLQWGGSANTFATILNPSAPLAKFSVNFQGFLILLNSATRKRGFFYEDENLQATNAWSNNFDIPSSADDEVTGSVVLRKQLYVSTRYSLFRVSFIGGNPDWSFRKIKDWGYVPRTMKVISLQDVGEVAVGLDWSRKLRLFDGTDDKIISTNIEADNDMCDFSMDKISFALSGLTISHAQVDANENVYKLCVAIGADSQSTTHTLNFDGRIQAFYPYQNTPFNTMCMAESANRRRLLAFDRSGYCHIVDSGNLDANRSAINDVFDSPFLYEKSPSSLSKNQKIDLFLSPTSSGTIFIQDRVDFDSTFKLRDSFAMSSNLTKVQIRKGIDIPQTAQIYQWRLTSSMNTADPWVLNRIDYFLHNMGIGENK